MAAITVYLAFLSRINAHSWVRCTDYNAEITGRDYDENECDGWISGWTFGGIPFAQDRGINYQVGVGSGQDLCANTGANSEKPTLYTVGSTIRVVWPAKNHANYECSSNIPDTAMKLYMNPTADGGALGNTESTMAGNGWTMVKDWQDGCNAGDDGCGFMNCPKFCEDTGAATCFGDFTVPSVSASGTYTFVWYWIFNPGSPYISCWDAYIDADSTDVVTPDATSGGSSGTVKGYLTQMPVCITGKAYDEEDVEDYVYAQFEDVVDSEDDIDILDVSEGTNSYNFTAQISHSSAGADITDVALNSFCDSYPGAICDNCEDVITFALFDDDASCRNVYYLSMWISLVMAVFFVW